MVKSLIYLLVSKGHLSDECIQEGSGYCVYVCMHVCVCVCVCISGQIGEGCGASGEQDEPLPHMNNELLLLK